MNRIDGVVETRLSAAPATIPMFGSDTNVNVWAYNGQVPGPELRVRQGDRLRLTLENRLDEETTIHWHGVRVPNAMDGVPHLTQAPVRPGGSFTYDFVVHDAGTYWYHPHQRSFEQVGRGLYAPLIVDEKEPIQVDRDLTWVLDDWRIDSSGQVSGGFGSRHDAMMAGRIGNTVTVNGRIPQPLAARSGERIRLRLINAANARIFGLNFGVHRPQIIAIDGQPVRPHEPNGSLLIGPAMRVDLILDMTSTPGARAVITDDFYKGLEYPLTQVVYSGSPLRKAPLSTSIQLPPNPLREPELRGAARHEILFGGGMMSMMGGSGDGMMRGGMMQGGMMGGSGGRGGGMAGMMGWTVNGVSATGHVHEPMLTIARGQTAVMDLKNDTAWWHPIHLHGHSFRVISRNGKPTQHREWQDTVLIPPQESAQIAFVADNPGDWMLHCHILEHQAAGMTAAFRVT
ncbi:MAG: multicopper oxidase family protein [Pseudomonadota bacterium]|nr:multicopper oxidase family protein [Pseudomonadota bacterium]